MISILQVQLEPGWSTESGGPLGLFKSREWTWEGCRMRELYFSFSCPCCSFCQSSKRPPQGQPKSWNQPVRPCNVFAGGRWKPYHHVPHPGAEHWYTLGNMQMAGAPGSRTPYCCRAPPSGQGWAKSAPGPERGTWGQLGCRWGPVPQRRRDGRPEELQE